MTFINQQIEVVTSKWLPKVNEFVTSVNNNFGSYLHRMKFAGEVCLIYGANMVYFLNYKKNFDFWSEVTWWFILS